MNTLTTNTTILKITANITKLTIAISEDTKSTFLELKLIITAINERIMYTEANTMSFIFLIHFKLSLEKAKT